MNTTTRRAFPPSPRPGRALLLRAHPNPESFNHALADAWRAGAEAAGLTVETIDVDSLDFDLRLHGPDFGAQPLEPAILDVQRAVAEASHLVVASPVWWGSVPASLKALVDRTFLPGWAYRTGEGAFPARGLTGRSARILLTMDAPGWYDRLVYGRSAARQLRDAWLKFVGMSPVEVTRFASIEKTSAEDRARMLAKAERIGARDAQRVGRRVPVLADEVA